MYDGVCLCVYVSVLTSYRLKGITHMLKVDGFASVNFETKWDVVITIGQCMHLESIGV